MRKVIAVFMMVFVVVFFYTSIQRRQPKNKNKKEVIHVIQEMKEALEEKYPENPMGVVEFNNEIVTIIYGKTLTEEELDEIVETQRLLYAQVFLDINPLDNHVLETQREIILNGEQEIKVIGSKIMNSHSDSEGTMRVQVVHYTNRQSQDLVREYIVKDENKNQPGEEENWKIYGWDNIGVIKAQEEKE